VKLQLLIPLLIMLHLCAHGQSFNCTFKEPAVTINFGTGPIGDRASGAIYNYRYVPYSCPSDGHYTYASATSDCFRGDWITLNEDHTAGDADGNMLIVNASYSGGAFFTTSVNRLKPSTRYEFSVWMLNVCRPTEKCPFPLLPDISIVLSTPEGKVQAQFTTGELIRKNQPEWMRYQVVFMTPASEGPLLITMVDNNPGGCGNDFALDDISFRECIIVDPPVTKKKTVKPPVVVVKKTVPPKVEKPVVKTVPPVVAKTVPPKAETPVVKKVVPPKVDTPKKVPVVVVKTAPVIPPKKPEARPPVKKDTVKTAAPIPEKRDPKTSIVTRETPDTIKAIKPRPISLPPPPALIAGRLNPLIKTIETPAGEIKIDLYDNGQVDGDTVSVYHNNRLMVSHARLSTTPVTIRIKIDANDPHHEIVLVAHNLGSIPPNTSLMVVNAGDKRFEVFISSNEQKNAKVVFDLKE
jgi:hypothetical protein